MFKRRNMVSDRKNQCLSGGKSRLILIIEFEDGFKTHKNIGAIY